DASYTDWGEDGESHPARSHYRVAWRKMAANTGERTLVPGIIPPNCAHIEGVRSLGLPQQFELMAVVAGFLSSLVSDFAVRSAPKNNIVPSTVARLPIATSSASFANSIALRALRLNCLTGAYGELWESVWREAAPDDPSEPHPFTLESWTGGLDYDGRPDLGAVGPTWTPEIPLRRDSDRRQALLEVDALVALSLGITADELVAIYRTQFPVLYGYDHGKYLYDANGSLVPTALQPAWRKKGDATPAEERTAPHPGSGVEYTYALPFRHLDREADLRRAAIELERLAFREALEPG